ncbi:hypothetical protein pipiens_013562 [Culex pipiens pipiens]|uniref:Uncharacterized protein n=1 Tax=Culex pipiens pipiens TaxID=38569 RepID=A0ABD1CY24_CULPP
MIFFRPPACSPDKSRALTTCQHRRRSSSSCARTSPSLSCPCPLSTPGINLSQLTAESLPDQRNAVVNSAAVMVIIILIARSDADENLGNCGRKSYSKFNCKRRWTEHQV